MWSEISLVDTFTSERLDSEHFKPNYLIIEAAIQSLGYTQLGDLVSYIKRGVQPQYDEEGFIPALRTVNIRQDGFSMTRQEYINQDFYDANPRGQIQHGDILITSTGVGTLGRVAYNYERQLFFADGHITILRRIEKLKPLFVTAFLQSHIGLDLIERRQRGSSGQIEIYPSDISSISIPIMPIQFQNEIEQHYLKANQLREQSKTLYAEAEALLLHELGLDALDLSVEAGYEGSFAEMMAADRMDAEYFQPRYKRLLQQMRAKGQTIRLGDWVATTIRRGVQAEYDEEGEFSVINSQHVGKTHVELEDNRRTSRAFVEANARAIVKPYDVLLNSTGYITIGRCQTFLDDVPAMVDSHVSIIRPKRGLDAVYLGLFLNGLPGQMQTEQGWTGSSGQIELRPDTIADYTIWLPSIELQLEIRQKVEQSHAVRREAERLLEEAKARVEAMILGA